MKLMDMSFKDGYMFGRKRIPLWSTFMDWICDSFHREYWEYVYSPPVRILRCLMCNKIQCIDDPKDNPCRTDHGRFGPNYRQR